MSKGFADIVLSGGTIFPGKNLPKNFDYIAIKDGYILSIGQGNCPTELIGESTKEIKFSKENLIMPGLHDNHVHLVLAGMLKKYVSLEGCKSEKEAAEKTFEFSKTIPDEEWVIGFGFSRLEWNTPNVLPTKESLDKLIPNRPVLLMDNELHSAWANSKAFEVAGVSKSTEDPMFGEIDRLPDGSPKGFLYESALSLVARKAFDFSFEVAKDLILKYCTVANSYGITSTSDMTPYLGIDLSLVDAFTNLALNNELTVRVNAARDLFEDLNKFLEIKKSVNGLDNSMYKVSYFKQFVDGVVANYTALLLEDYSDKEGEKGGTLLSLDKLETYIEAANRNQIPVRLHACGDGAVRVILDSFENVIKSIYGEEALKDKSKTGYEKGFIRNQMEHIEMISKEDISRLQKLGVIASVQPEHIISGTNSHSENCYPELIGPERERYTWAFNSLLKAGTILACGSDMPVVAGNSFIGVYVGLTRLHDDGTPEGGWNAPEKISVEELLHGYTMGASYAEGKEAELGILEVGKLADICVTDKNLLTVSPEEIKNAAAILTIVNGKIVYSNLKN